MARIGLPALGTLSYNDQSFDGAIHIDFNEQRIRDEADRTVIFNEVTIGVDFFCTAADFANVRANLAEDGKVLIFENKGFGVAINTANKPDLKLGPKTGPLHATDLGGGNVLKCHWSVTTYLAECPDAATSGIIAINYQMNFNVDAYGLTTRTINGYYQIAQTRLGDNRVKDSADRYRHLLNNVAVPKGYRREQSYANSADRSRCNFTITDSPIRSRIAYPKTVAEINGQHTFHWGIHSAAQPRHTLSVSMVPVSSSANRGLTAVLTFFSLLQTKLAKISPSTKPGELPGKTLFITDLSINEDIFGLPVSCSAGWIQFIDPNEIIKNILAITGQFIDVGTKWDSWHRDVATNLFDVRGAQAVSVLDTAILEDPAGLDRIVDPCNTLGPQITSGEPPAPKMNDPGKFPAKQGKPDPESSYLDYKGWLEVNRDTPVGQLKYSQPPGTDATSQNWEPTSDQGIVFPTSPITSTGSGNQGSNGDDVIYYAGRSSYTVEFCGHAIRAGYPVPRPSLSAFGVRQASEQKGRFVNSQINTFLGVPVYAASWRIRYLITGSPGDLQLPAPQTT